MLFEVLTQQVLAVVVAVRRAHDRVDVLPSGHTRRQLTLHADGTLVVELDQDDGALNPVVETLRLPQVVLSIRTGCPRTELMRL